MSFITIGLLLFISLSISLSWLFKRVFGFHPLDKVPGPRPSSWLWGHMSEIFGADAIPFHTKLAEEFGPTLSFRSFAGERVLYTYDPYAMHQILVKDQVTDVFERSPVALETFTLMFGGGLVAIVGESHRKQRKTLTPVFSIAHMREMVPIFYNVTHKLEKTLAAKVGDGPREIDMLSWMSRTALELVGQAGLGYSFDDLKDEKHAHPYVKALKGLAPLLTRGFLGRILIMPFTAHYGTPTIRKVGSWLLSYISKDFVEGKEMADYMWSLSKEIFESKKQDRTAGLGEQLAGKDIISVLMKENAKAMHEDRLEDDELIAQMSTLTFAAMDTTSSALSRILSLLATYPAVQKRLREEISGAFDEGDIPYDQLVSLPYLDAIARETLRLYPPIHQIMRTQVSFDFTTSKFAHLLYINRAYKDTTLSLYEPITLSNGTVANEIFVPKSMNIVISVINSNKNKALWGDDADEWKPERWLSPLPSAVSDARIPGVYSHLMTFNGGGRSCIGFKFSQLEMKVVLSLLIHRFEFSHSKRNVQWQSTTVASPVVRDQNGGLSQSLPLIVRLVDESL